MQDRINNSNIGIGIEKEIYSCSYFSYHYGYKNLINSNTNLIQLENLFFPYFKKINFNVIFLNISKKGNYLNFCLKNNPNYLELEKYLNIRCSGNASSFSLKVDDLGKNNIIHREIYAKPDLKNFKFSPSNLNTINHLIEIFKPQFFCIGFDCMDKKLNLNDIHLELYPNKNIASMKHFLNILEKLGVSDISCFKKYFLDFRKFSHIKIRIKESEITNIKYYRSINVSLPNFYYG